MRPPVLHDRVTSLLHATNTLGGYPLSLVCTEEGLLIASSGGGLDTDEVAAFTSLFDEIVRRAVTYLGFASVDEVTLLDPGRGRYVIRPLQLAGSPRMFLVVQMDPKLTWRRNTNQLCAALVRILGHLSSAEAPEEQAAT